MGRNCAILWLLISGLASIETVHVQSHQLGRTITENKNKHFQMGDNGPEKRRNVADVVGLNSSAPEEQSKLIRMDESSAGKDQRTPNDSSMNLSCCDTLKSNPANKSAAFTKKDILVKNPKKVHFYKKIVGDRFLGILKALNEKNGKDARATKRKIHDDKLSTMLSNVNDEDKDEKVSIYNIEGTSELSRNKTIVELRHAILKLLDKYRQKAKSPGVKKRKKYYHHKEKKAMKADDNKSTKTEIEENDDTVENTNSSPMYNNLSARQANTLDLLNFIARMKGLEFGVPVNPYSLNRIQRLNYLDTSGLSSMLNARDLMSQGLASPMNEMQQLQQGELNKKHLNARSPSSNGMQVQEMNLAEQRKLIEDQMQNHVAELQLKARLRDLQQEIDPMQTLPSNSMPKFGSHIYNRMSTSGMGSFNAAMQPLMSYQPTFPRLNSFLPFMRPIPRFSPRLPFYPRFHRRFRYPAILPRFHRRNHYPVSNYDDDADYDDNDDDDDNGNDDYNDDDDRNHTEAPIRRLPPDDEDDGGDDDDDEHSHSYNYER